MCDVCLGQILSSGYEVVYAKSDDPEDEEDYELADFESDEDEDNDFTKD